MEKTSSNKIIDSSLQYLDGPNSRGRELIFTVKTMLQFIKGFRQLHFVGPCITVFGSARFSSDHPYYIKAVEVGKRICTLGFTVMTGGGPGIMEAANKGAFECGGYSVGCTIKLPKEQTTNPFMHRWVEMDYFFIRKFLLLKYSYAFVVMPGGFGTMDELFETVTLIQTSIIHQFPIVIIGTSYFAPLQNLINEMIEVGTISQKDLDLIHFTDDLSSMEDHISAYVSSNYTIRNRRRPWSWLGEKGRSNGEA